MIFEKVWDFLAGKKAFFKAMIWGIGCVIANAWKTAWTVLLAVALVVCLGGLYGFMTKFSQEEVRTLKFGFIVFVVYTNIIVRSMAAYIDFPITVLDDDKVMRWVFDFGLSFVGFVVGLIFIAAAELGIYAGLVAMAFSHILIATWFKWMITPEAPSNQKQEPQWCELPWIQVSETT
jgi:hypothetical protein